MRLVLLNGLAVLPVLAKELLEARVTASMCAGVALAARLGAGLILYAILRLRSGVLLLAAGSR